MLNRAKVVSYLAAHRAALLAAALIVVVGTVTAASQSPMEMVGLQSQRICAEFTDATGLYVGNNVSMLGVTVGRIDRIEQRRAGVEVHMKVRKSLKLPADVGALVVASSIVTDRRVEFTKPYTAGATYPVARCIPLNRTRTPKGISDTLDGVNRTAAALLGGNDPTQIRQGREALDKFIANATAITDGTGPQLNEFLGSLSKVLGNTSEVDGTVRRMVDSLYSLTNMFVTNWPDLKALLDNLSGVVRAVQGATNGLGEALAYANEFLPVAVRNIGRYDKQLYGLADTLVPYSHELLKRVDNIGDLIRYLPIAMGKLPGLVDPIMHALLFTYKSPRFVTTSGGKKLSMNLADLLTSMSGAR
ncbi:MCE family protein [Gordonia sp. CPCC 205333]|uniref:MCE family protein n=1 Tax=Gordonia sp. CPCC 205333 TaxID=3140790 RepID=UPI003AF3FB78